MLKAFRYDNLCDSIPIVLETKILNDSNSFWSEKKNASLNDSALSANYLSYNVIIILTVTSSTKSNKKLCVQMSVKMNYAQSFDERNLCTRIINSKIRCDFCHQKFCWGFLIIPIFMLCLIVWWFLFSLSLLYFPLCRLKIVCVAMMFVPFSKLHLNYESVVNYGIERL